MAVAVEVEGLAWTSRNIAALVEAYREDGYEPDEIAHELREAFPLPGAAPRGDRAAARAVVEILRECGLTIREIIPVTGYSRSYISDMINDPDGSRCRARKDSYRGTCEDCGGPTDGSNGSAKAPTICARCKAVALHEERFWTRESIIEAFRAASELLGRTVTVSDVVYAKSIERRYSDERKQEWVELREEIKSGRLRFPAVSIVQRELGSWREAQRAAGLEPSDGGGEPSHRVRRPSDT